MTDLTEQWRKGELPSGWYWVDYYSVDGAVMLEYIPQHNGFGYEEKELVQAVLAPVPSYEEWQAAYEYEKYADNEIKNLKAQNAQLKELLKGAKEIIEWYKDDCGSKDIETEAMLQHINQALGEDK